MGTRGERSVKDWDELWQKNKIRWHISVVHADLQKHEEKLFPSKSRVFVPLCGKTIDMKYLAEKGHEVVGLEFSQKACLDFMEENSLSFTKQKHPGSLFYVYTAKELPITLYQGDMYQANSEILGQFDAVWDRGSFISTNAPDRSRYIAILCDLVKPNGKVLLNLFTYDGTKFQGPPHTIEKEEVQELFGKSFKIEVLDDYEFVNAPFKPRELDKVIATNYMLSKAE